MFEGVKLSDLLGEMGALAIWVVGGLALLAVLTGIVGVVILCFE